MNMSHHIYQCLSPHMVTSHHPTRGPPRAVPFPCLLDGGAGDVRRTHRLLQLGLQVEPGGLGFEEQIHDLLTKPIEVSWGIAPYEVMT